MLKILGQNSNENVIETRIVLKYDTYTNWMSSDVILEEGEIGICSFPRANTLNNLSDDTPDNTPPAIGLKVGDGYHYFRRLPWVQATAADVYSWAKQDQPPTASEIPGLDAYIQEYISGGGSGGGNGTRTYQIVRGTDQNINKYYLQYRSSIEDDWVVDTAHYIDVNDFVRVYNWITNAAMVGDPNLTVFTEMQIRDFLEANLNNNDEVVNNQFVTAAIEESGMVTINRRQPSFTDISGVATVEQGGTGRDTLAEGEVLIGNGEGRILTRPIADEIANNNYLVPNNVIKSYVDTKTAGLTGAMHFIGEATVDPATHRNPQIQDYNINNAQPGDVILYEQQEFVWDGSQWILLGDEGSYAVKGSIVNNDINDDAAIDQSKIASITGGESLIDDWNVKVDKEEGKQLSSNDFSDEYKDKLDSIAEGAQVNVIEHIILNDDEKEPQIVDGVPKTVVLTVKEFDDEARQKLNGIEAHAEVNIIESIKMDGITILPDQDRVISLQTAPHLDHVNKIEKIFVNNVEQEPNANKEVHITVDTNYLIGGQTVNPSGVTENLSVNSRYLQLAYVAKTGDIKHLIQEQDEYIIINCGTSETVMDRGEDNE